MAIEFDLAKDAKNVAQHGVSLARAGELEIVAYVNDTRFDEPRIRAYGYMAGKAYCLAFTYRGANVRAISLRRARAKEMRRHTQPATAGL